MRKVTERTRKLAFRTIKVVVAQAASEQPFLTYSDLAERLEISNRTGQGLAKILDEAAEMCRENGHPDVSVMVVTKASLDAGSPMPSPGSFVDGKTKVSGISETEVPAEQARVRDYHWATEAPTVVGEIR
ncbi:hypothetical protein [Jannaschia aquimarina]|uniref:hypothetical protein n=1 Tax=Jannaschia aquimarina TaxID=935700 RepID=UPI0005C77510|nr:hypothetical protein [Jannaschia aquimarina]